jgi:hypothetical protein
MTSFFVPFASLLVKYHCSRVQSGRESDCWESISSVRVLSTGEGSVPALDCAMVGVGGKRSRYLMFLGVTICERSGVVLWGLFTHAALLYKLSAWPQSNMDISAALVGRETKCAEALVLSRCVCGSLGSRRGAVFCNSVWPLASRTIPKPLSQ